MGQPMHGRVYEDPAEESMRPGAQLPGIASPHSPAYVGLIDELHDSPVMPVLIAAPTTIAAAGTKPKQIEEYAGMVNSGHRQVSLARMISPEGWVEPGQTPEFEEITLVLRGMLRVEHHTGALEVRSGQAVVAEPGEWVRYSTPEPGGAEYIAVCLPAFSPETVHRDKP
jgi:mannose-6-phosphate isomerase-like protein (cupin superfamily)